MSNIYNTDVTFNKPLTNIKDIILVNPTDNLLTIQCSRLNISGELVAKNFLATETLKIGNNINVIADNVSKCININYPILPYYTYTLNGTNIPGTIGYIYTKMATFTTALNLNTETDITGNLNDPALNVNGGIYMLKLDISYNNIDASLASTIPLKVIHRFNGYNMLTNVTYFKNKADIHTYSNTCIININTNQPLFHGIRIPRNIYTTSLFSNISTTIVNKQYRLSLLKIG